MGIQEGVAVYNYLVNEGLSPLAAAGYAGHFAEETGWFDPNVISLQRRGDGGVARGMAQWHPDRWVPLEAYARNSGIDPTSWQGQLQMMLHESRSGRDPGAARAMREANAASTLEDAVAAVAHFERSAGYKPNNPAGIDTFGKRLSHARKVLEAAGGPYSGGSAFQGGHSGEYNANDNGSSDPRNAFGMLMNSVTNPYYTQRGPGNPYYTGLGQTTNRETAAFGALMNTYGANPYGTGRL